MHGPQMAINRKPHFARHATGEALSNFPDHSLVGEEHGRQD